MNRTTIHMIITLLNASAAWARSIGAKFVNAMIGLLLSMTFVLAVGPRALATEKNTSSDSNTDKDAFVMPGDNGKLKYVPDEKGNQIPDFSRCGYMGGGVKLPDVPVKLTLEPRPGMAKDMTNYNPDTPHAYGEGDDTERIQAAIEKVSTMPLDKNGHRGALLLKRGVYRVEGQLFVKASGVVLRGEGQFKDGTIILGTGTNQRTLVVAEGNRKATEVEGSRLKITDSYVPWGVFSFNLESTKGLSVGDKVIVHRPLTEPWCKAIGMERWATDIVFKGRHFNFERTITAIDGNRVTLNAPTVNAMEDKFGGGFVYRYKEEGGVSRVGIEQLRIISAFVKKGADGMDDEDHVWDGVNMNGCFDSWVSNVTAVHVGFACVQIRRNSKFVTVQDCSYLEPVSSNGGGRRYPYQFDDAQFCLMQRCYSERGRHSNSCSALVRGPNAWLDMVNRHGDAGPHHRWSMGILYDNISSWHHIAPDRRKFGAHGWAGAQIVHWNGSGHGGGVAQPPTARNYMFGMDVKEGQPEAQRQKPVTPRSLYLQQLEERLGKEAVENVTTEAQRTAVTDARSELSREKLIWGPIKATLSK